MEEGKIFLMVVCEVIIEVILRLESHPLADIRAMTDSGRIHTSMLKTATGLMGIEILYSLRAFPYRLLTNYKGE